MPSNKTAKQRGRHAVKRLLPYAFLCTVGPSVTAATALLIVVSLPFWTVWIEP